MNNKTNPDAFQNPYSLKHKIKRLLWNVVQRTFFRYSPTFSNVFRLFLLRIFGADVGKAYFHPTVQIWAPWKLIVGDSVYIDYNVNVYNSFGVNIKDRVVISQNSFLCTASHDYEIYNYPLIGGEIVIEEDSWITANVFISPGITITTGTVVGACSVVTKNTDPWTVVAGNPAKFIKKREIKDNNEKK